MTRSVVSKIFPTEESKEYLLGFPCRCFSTHNDRASKVFASVPPGSFEVVTTCCLTCGRKYWSLVIKANQTPDPEKALSNLLNNGTVIMDDSEAELLADINDVMVKMGITKDMLLVPIVIYRMMGGKEYQSMGITEHTEGETKKPIIDLFKKFINRR